MNKLKLLQGDTLYNICVEYYHTCAVTCTKECVALYKFVWAVLSQGQGRRTLDSAVVCVCVCVCVCVRAK
jgi:hypothetical protein